MFENINGVKITSLKKIEDDRGKLLHMIKNKSNIFEKFGEIYFSFTNLNIIKGWYRHKKNTLNMAVIFGECKFVLYDKRQSSPTKNNLFKLKLSLKNYSLLTIPPMIWYGFKTIGEHKSIIANCTTLEHSSREMERLPINTKRYHINGDKKEVCNMKVVILAGGFGTRIRDVSENIPKPMIQIGTYPILWHIMKYFSTFGFKEFIICLGFKGNVIRDFFINYDLYMKDVTIELGKKYILQK